jgi:hypothetical protein
LYTSLEAWYRTTWALSYYYRYSLTEINELIPFERDLYVALTNQRQEEEKEEREKNQ